MACTKSQNVQFGIHMLLEEAKDWWDNTRQILEAISIKITWVMFKKEFLEKYFPKDVRGKKEIEFIELKQGNMIVAEYAAKFEALIRRYVELVNKSRIYDEDRKAQFAHYKSLSEKKGKGQFRGKPYVTPVDKGKQKASYGKKTSGGGAPASIKCFNCGEMGHRANEFNNKVL
ncbi:uncharacterized protein LOC127080451 [Lathyrus oleraceus]|uniref:uncharacterized protein LOC127080451 n=1 Tax=Pisum sativum TaxID=3888 RepID=UPI0021CDF0C6|nr:uncharacterized protein LOC127080451 [Pisum sativum]